MTATTFSSSSRSTFSRMLRRLPLVTMTMESEAMTRLDFVRDTDAPRSFTFASDGNDDEHSTTFALVCHFLLAHWPSDSQRKTS
jgi:hypothetical protein